MANAIEETERDLAKKLASRRDGVTAAELAGKVGSIGRARKILTTTKGITGRALGGLGKASRTLTYTLSK